MRLIDADALADALFEVKFHATAREYQLGWNDALENTAENAPTIDAVPVIRCKNCKYYNLQALVCTHDNFNGRIGIDGFCSYGKPKGERKE